MPEGHYYTPDELRAFGFRTLGQDVLVSRKSSLYQPAAIAIGNHVRIDDFCVLTGGQGITLGNHVHVACHCALFGGSGIELEDFSGLAARVTIYSESDDYSGVSLTNPTVPRQFKPRYECGRVTLRRHVIVGASSTVLPGVCIGEGAAVGAHSLVTKDCESWHVYFGAPAKKLKRRSRALLELERSFRESR